MNLLPREHGATVIWFSSVITSILTLQAFPTPDRAVLFLAAAIAILLSTAQLTSRSQTLIRIRRSRLFLPILSGSLTLITPLGGAVLTAAVSAKNLAVWMLLLTYTVVSVALVQGRVQGLIRGRESPSKQIALPGLGLLAGESLILSSTGLMHPATLLSLTPLLLMWIYLSRSRSEKREEWRLMAIKRLGFQQTGNMIAFVVALAVLSRL